ncbi:MAG: hypothetical protein JXB32_21655 [Deltaproteobacteria bacterium]|nr:hypothetical protein [Deltaproteobacteria bacterium]
MARTPSRLALVGLPVALAGLLACDAPAADPPAATKLAVAVWTDLEIPAQLGLVEFLLEQDGEQVRAVRPLDPRGHPQPIVAELELGYLDRTRSLELRVVGRTPEIGSEPSLVAVERRLRFARLPPGTSAAAVTLEARCAGLDCRDGWTCVDGACERPDVPESVLAGSVEELPPDPLGRLVAGRPVDACVVDADCEDGDPCTIDRCSTNFCSSESPAWDCVLCTEDADCPAPDDPCFAAFCHDYGVCWRRAVRPGTRCDDDDDPCTVQCCRELSVCMTFDVCAEPDVPTGCDP